MTTSRRTKPRSSSVKQQQPDPEIPPQVPVESTAPPEPKVVVPEVVEELSEAELADRQRLELKVERAFVEAGNALRELRDRRLYRDSYKTFEEYCQNRFGFGRAHSYRLIDAAIIMRNLETKATVETMTDLSPNRRQILPTRLEQVRPLSRLEADEQREIWQQAVEAAGGKVPSGRAVKSIVDRIKERTFPELAKSYKKGDVFLLQGLQGSERRYNSCWGIVKQIHEFSLEVDVHDRALLVKPDNLNPIAEREVRKQLPGLLRRIRRLRKFELDRGAIVILEALGKQIYLTDVEEGLLAWLERYYGVARA